MKLVKASFNSGDDVAPTNVLRLNLRDTRGVRFSFNISNIPYFCGALLLHDFAHSITFNLQNVDKEEFVNQLIPLICNQFDLNEGMLLVWWDKTDGLGAALANLLGAEESHKFINPNSDNQVAMYSWEVPSHECFYDI